jgi:putative endonuclease
MDLAARRMLNMYYTYVLLSLKDGQFYTGYTSNLRKRLAEHNNGESKSTMHRRPLTLIYFEGCLDIRDAMRREKYLKSGNGKIYLKNRLRKYLENVNNQ